MFQEVIERPIQTKPATPVHGRVLMIEWLKTKDPGEAYDWNSASLCLMAQFIREANPTDEQIRQIDTAHISQGPQPASIEDFRRRRRHWTFGQALARATE